MCEEVGYKGQLYIQVKIYQFVGFSFWAVAPCFCFCANKCIIHLILKAWVNSSDSSHMGESQCLDLSFHSCKGFSAHCNVKNSCVWIQGSVHGTLRGHAQIVLYWRREDQTQWFIRKPRDPLQHSSNYSNCLWSTLNCITEKYSSSFFPNSNVHPVSRCQYSVRGTKFVAVYSE